MPPKNSEVIFKLQFYILPKCQEMWIHMKVTGRYARILKKTTSFHTFCQKLLEDVVWQNEGVQNQKDTDIEG